MATVYSFKERAALVREAIDALQKMLSINSAVEGYRDHLLDQQAGYDNVSNQINGLLDDLFQIRDRVKNEMDTLTFTYEELVFPYSSGNFTSVQIQENVSGKGVLTANGGTPFSVFQAADKIGISNTENRVIDANGEATYTVSSVDGGGASITVATTFPSGSQDAGDKTIRIRLRER